MKVRFTTILILLLSVTCIAAADVQDSVPRKEKRDFLYAIGDAFTKVFRGFNDFDTAYIEPQHYNYTTMVQNTNTYEAYTLKSKSGQSIMFAPRPTTKIGPYIGWRWLFLGYTFDVNNINDGSRKSEFDLSLYSSLLGIDLYYRKTGDNYRIRRTSLGKGVSHDLFYGIPFDGLSVSIKGFDVYYIFNHKRFSYPAAFSQSTRQKISCGSPLLGIGYTSHSLSLDYNALKNVLERTASVYGSEVKLDEDFNFNNIKYESYSVSGGYAYNWVFARNCLFSSALSVAVAYKQSKGDITEENGNSKNEFNFKNFNFDGIGRFGFVWNNNKWFAGASTVLHLYNYKKSRFTASSYFGSLNVYAGLNFGLQRKYRKKPQ